MDTLKKDAGTVLMIGLPGPELAPETAERVESLAPGGLILFRRNLSEPDATSKLLSDTAARMPAPAWFAIDQEGGRVSRLAPWIGPTPTAAELAGAGVDTVTRFGRATGEALRGLGFNLDFAPVVDLSPVDADNGIGSRAYHPTPERTIEFARGFLVGLQGSGVAGCLKHFPGLGRTTVDSHQSLPQVQRSLGELESEELVPFRELCAEAASVMVGHGHYTALAHGVASLGTVRSG